MTLSQKPLRTIRSYVKRKGRSTPYQTRALTDYWSQFGIPSDSVKLDLAQIFPREAPTALEIGFGMGDHLLHLAAHQPDWNFLGVEVHEPGVARVLARANDLQLTNLKIIAEDVVNVLERLPAASLDRVLLLFPDPWPKKKHHKRRLVQTEFAELVADKLKPNGQFRLATDWEPYADHMLSVLDSCPVFTNEAGAGNFLAGRGDRPQTKFEMRGQRLGHAIRDLSYLRA